MNESNGGNTAELADILWERQGRPVDHSTQNWLEAEYRAHPPASFQRPNNPQNEADLRMRGLGSLTPSEAPKNGEVEKPKSSWLKLSCVAGAGLVIAAGMVYSFSKGRR